MSHTHYADPYYCSSTAVMANGKCPEPINLWEILLIVVVFIFFASALIWFNCYLAKKLLKKKMDVGIVKGKHISLNLGEEKKGE